MHYKPELLEKAKELYPDWTLLHTSIEKGDRYMIERCLSDSCEGLSVDPREIISARTDDDIKKIKEKAKRVIQKKQLYSDFVNGCFIPYSPNDVTKCQFFGCPRRYGQITVNADVLREFECWHFGYFPDCSFYGTDNCWNKFFEKGFKFE